MPAGRGQRHLGIWDRATILSEWAVERRNGPCALAGGPSDLRLLVDDAGEVNDRLGDIVTELADAWRRGFPKFANL